MAHQLVDAEHELLQDAQPRLDGAQLCPEFNVTGHFVFCGLFLFSNMPDYTITPITRFLEQKTLEGIKLSFLFSELQKKCVIRVKLVKLVCYSTIPVQLQYNCT